MPTLFDAKEFGMLRDRKTDLSNQKASFFVFFKEE